MRIKKLIFYTKAVLFFGLSLFSLNSFGQNWQKLFSDSPFYVSGGFIEFRGDMYDVGYDYSDVSGTHGYLMKWDGNNFCKAPIDENDTIKFSYATGICPYKDELIVAGAFKTKHGKSYNLAGWDGLHWHLLGEGTIDGGDAMAVYHDTVYVNGEYNFKNPSPYVHISKWDGKSWHSVGIGSGSSKNSVAYSMLVYKDELYVSGIMNAINGTKCTGIARWNGSRWDSVGKGIRQSEQGSSNLIVFRNELYVSEPQDSHSFKAQWVKWNGKNWTEVNYPCSPNSSVGYSPVVTYNVNHKDSFMYMTTFTEDSDFLFRGDGNHWVQEFEIPRIAQLGWYCSMFDYNGTLYAVGKNWFGKWNPRHIDSVHTPQYKIFPNPVSDHLTIETYYPDASMDFELYNCAGQKLLSGILPPNTCCTEVSTDNYPAGLYFLRLRSGNNWKTEKIELLR